MSLTRTAKKHPNPAFRPYSLEITKMPLRTNPATENQYGRPLLENRKDEIPCLHGAMKVVELRSTTHA